MGTRRLASILCLAVTATAAAFPSAAEPLPAPVRLPVPEPAKPARPQYDRHTVLFRFTPGLGASARSAAMEANGVRRIGTVWGTDDVVADTGGRAPTAVVADLRRDGRVALAQLNYLRHATVTPNDPYYGPWQSPYLSTLRMTSAWGVTKGSLQNALAIVDTGIDAGHPDLSGRIKPGYDFANKDSNPGDDNGHGTFVAGVAAAKTNNGIGVAGTGWNTSIIPVKVLGKSGNGTDANVASGIRWAANHGAKVINLSLGGPGASQVLQDAVNYAALTKNVLVVAAAGNEGREAPSYPAAYANALAVTATDGGGTFASFSNFGWWVDLAAPGETIVSTFPRSKGSYAVGDGTSFSAPLVAGVAALLRWKNPGWSQAQVAHQLRTSAHDVGPAGLDPFYGFGVLDGYAALGGGRLPASPQPAGDALEPDGTQARGTLMTSSASATISPEGDADWFAVDLASPATITWTVVPPATNDPLAMDPILEVYTPGPDLRLLGRVDSFGDGQSETIVVGGVTAGRYRLRVTNHVGSRSPGPYTVNVSLSSATGTSSGSLLWVSDTTPPDFAQGEARTVHPTVEFVRTMDASSFSGSSVLLLNGATGAILAHGLSYNAPSRTLTITPATLLAANTPYVVLISGVRDTSSNVMPNYLAFRFTTGA